MRETAAVIVVLFALACSAASLAAASGAQAPGQHMADFTVVVGGYEMYATVAGLTEGENSTVLSHLISSTGVVKARATAEVDDDGSVDISFVRRGAGRPVPALIEHGDSVLTVVDGVPATRIAIPDLASEADPLMDVVSGSAPMESRVSVVATSPGGGLASGSAVADAGGHWSVDLSGDLDLVPGSRGVAVLTAAGGGRYQSEWLVRDINVRIGDNALTIPARSGQTVEATVANEAGGVTGTGFAVAWGDRAELWLRDGSGDRAPVLPGDMLSLRFASGEVINLQAPPLTAAVDAEADSLSGSTLPGDHVGVQVDGTMLTATAGDDGRWSVDLSGAHDLTFESVAVVSTASAPWCSLTARAERLVGVGPFTAAVEVQGTAGAPVRMQLLRAETEPSPQGRDGDPPPYVAYGWFGPEGALRLFVPKNGGQEMELATGDRMGLSIGETELEFESPPLEAFVDPSGPSVSGRTAPGNMVLVHHPEATVGTTATLEGLWSVDFPPGTRLDPADPVDVLVEGADGYRAGHSFLVLRATASPGTSMVEVEAGRGVKVAVDLVGPDRERPVGTGGCTVWLRSCRTMLADASLDLVTISPGDRVIVRPSVGVTAELEISALTAHIDLPGKSVTGEGPPGGRVHIAFSRDDDEPTPIDTSKEVFGSGVYDYELRGSEQDLLTPGLIAEVTSELESRHRLGAKGVVEVVRANNGSVAWGLAEPRTPMRAELHDSSGVLVSDAEANASDDASFWLDLRLGPDAPVKREPLVRSGDTVIVTHRLGSHAVPILPLAGSVTEQSGAVLGITAPNRRLRSRYSVGTFPGSYRNITVPSGSDESGLFYLEAPPVDLTTASADPYVDVFTPAGDTFSTIVGRYNELSTLYVPIASRAR